MIGFIYSFIGGNQRFNKQYVARICKCLAFGIVLKLRFRARISTFCDSIKMVSLERIPNSYFREKIQYVGLIIKNAGTEGGKVIMQHIDGLHKVHYIAKNERLLLDNSMFLI